MHIALSLNPTEEYAALSQTAAWVRDGRGGTGHTPLKERKRAMFTMDEKTLKCRAALIGLTTTLALLVGSSAQAQPRDRGDRSAGQSGRSAPPAVASRAPEMRSAPSGGPGGSSGGP